MGKAVSQELDNKHSQMHLCGKDNSLQVEETEHALVVAGTKLVLLEMGFNHGFRPNGTC